MFFFVKQKTAYEMRISDWSSDVCSSDLYDRVVHGESAYFVWLNRGKESVAVDLKQADDLALVQRMLAKADVFIQNLAPGAAGRLGLGHAGLRDEHPRLITCDISGYGETGPYARSEEHTSELQSLMRISYAVFCLKPKKTIQKRHKK